MPRSFVCITVADAYQLTFLWLASAAQDALGPQVQAAAIAVQGLHRAVTEDTQEAGSRY